MHPNPNMTGWAFYPLWAIICLLGTILAFLMFFVLEVAVGESQGLPVALTTGLALLSFGLIFGFLVGLAQFFVLRRSLPDSSAWISATLLGFLVASPAVLAWGGSFGPVIPLGKSLLMGSALGLACGLFQWLLFRKTPGLSPLWIPLSGIAWLAADLAGQFFKGISFQMGPIYFWVGFIFFGILMSGIFLALTLPRLKK